MACQNHPNAPTAATCKSCGVELCGMCTKFLDSGEYCEKCAVVAEADAYMKSRSREMEYREAEAAHASIGETTAEKESIAKAKDQDKLYIWGGVGTAMTMLCVALGLYAFPNLLTDGETLARQDMLMDREQCRLVFEEIGYLLARGEMPDPSMRCEGTNTPNIINRNGNTVRVSHPNPAQLGLLELSVNSQSHDVTMIEGSQS